MAEQTLERHQGDYVPDYTPGPIAAGATGTAEKVAPDYDRLRNLVPTDRQSVQGDGAPDDLAPAFGAHGPVEDAPRESRREVFSRYLNSVNPWAIQGPTAVALVFGLRNLLGGMDEQVFSLATPEITASFGISITSLVWVQSLAGSASMLLGLPLGYLVDRVRRISLVRLAAVGHFIGVLARLVAPTYGTFAIASLAGSVAATGGSAAEAPLQADYFPSRSRARVLGFLALMKSTGGLISLPIVGLLTTIYGWRMAVTVLALPSLLVALLVFVLKEPVRGGIDRLEMGVSAERAAVEQAKPTFQEALRGSWAIRTVRLTVIAQFMVGFAAPMQTVLQYVGANEYSLDPFQRSLIGWGGQILIIPVFFIATGLTQRLLLESPSRVMLLISVLLMIPAMLPLLVLLHPPVILFFFINMVALWPAILLSPVILVIKLQATPARFRGVSQQLDTPFLLVTMLVSPAILQSSIHLGLTATLAVFTPFVLAGGLISMMAAGSISRDIRAARAAAVAEEESATSKAARQNKLLVCRDVDLLIDEVQILSHVDLDVREGEILALVGTNGAGKSTLLRTICGLQPASNGAVFFDGEDCTFRPTHENARDGIVYMPGGQGVFPLMSVRDNLHTAAWMQRKDEAAVREGVERVLAMFPRLRERLDAQAGAMSGGEQQMLAVGQAFLMKPRLLMIDELSLGLAPAIVEQLLDTLREMRDEGVTIILVEQSLNVALTVADRAVFMEKGEIRFDGPTEELLARPDLVRSVFMGGAGGGAVTASRRRAQSALDERESLLRCDHVSIAFGGVAALTDVDLDVAAGEVVGIIGPNGAGKTTLFDVFSGYLTPDSGSVHLGDRDVSRLSPDARARLGLGRAFQNARLFPPLTVRENIAVALERRAAKSSLLAAAWAPPVRRSERKLYTRVDGFIELLGLTAYADKFVRELSTGTRRAVEVACQMAAEPKVLLLDEPSSGLAQAEAEALGPALARIVKETGCGMLLIEHDLNLISRVSDRLVAMELGQVITSGTPDRVLRDPRVLQSYLAASSDVIDRSGSRIGSVLAAVVDDLPAPASPDQTTSS